MSKYIIGIDQSTQGTKALLFNELGELICRTDLAHQQYVNDKGWVSHDIEEIYNNTVQVIKNLIEQSGISKKKVLGIGISNQRETTAMWHRECGKALAPAIVWQCARAKHIAEEVKERGLGEQIREKTGIPLSPYFPAAKMSWLLRHCEGAEELAHKGEICLGTIDSWLVYKLTKGKQFKTDYSNASRTQLFNIHKLMWDEEICKCFGIPMKCLPEVCDSNSLYGVTDLEGYFQSPIPIHGVLGDSHGALFGQGCHEKGMIKTTYGTGSSIMMHIGETPILSQHGLVTSLAWGIDGKVSYVLEGNINYTGAVITWLVKDLELLESPYLAEKLAREASEEDQTYLVPAFTGLGAPYWESEATGIITGITRTTKKSEIIKAALESIAYQITDIVLAMEKDSGITIKELRGDGGPTKNSYLMQFQSDITGISIKIPEVEELSGIGAAYMAGIALNLFTRDMLLKQIRSRVYTSKMTEEKRKEKYRGWKQAIQLILKK